MDQNHNLHNPHDKEYKYLLSSKRAYIELLRSFIHRDWVQYWWDILKNIDQNEASRKDFRLPAIVPIVLYNGKQPWTAKRRFRDELSGQQLFGDELLDFQYFLIDVHRYTEEELSQLLSDEQLHRLSTWIQHIFKWRLPPDSQLAVEELASSMQRKEGVNEMLTNFERVLDEWIEQKEVEGMEKGMEKGRLEALERVAREMLAADMPLEQIERFTNLPREKLEELKQNQH